MVFVFGLATFSYANRRPGRAAVGRGAAGLGGLWSEAAVRQYLVAAAKVAAQAPSLRRM